MHSHPLLLVCPRRWRACICCDCTRDNSTKDGMGMLTAWQNISATVARRAGSRHGKGTAAVPAALVAGLPRGLGSCTVGTVCQTAKGAGAEQWCESRGGDVHLCLHLRSTAHMVGKHGLCDVSGCAIVCPVHVHNGQLPQSKERREPVARGHRAMPVVRACGVGWCACKVPSQGPQTGPLASSPSKCYTCSTRQHTYDGHQAVCTAGTRRLDTPRWVAKFGHHVF